MTPVALQKSSFLVEIKFSQRLMSLRLKTKNNQKKEKIK